MPAVPPPPLARASLHAANLEPGTRLWRMHGKDRPGSEFRSAPSDDIFGGGRFDGTTRDPYPFLYASPEPQTVLLETLTSGIPFNHEGYRLIRRAAVAHRVISALELTESLTLIALLSGADLVAAYQDEWLISSSPAEFAQTRTWAQWLRSQATWAQGITWHSVRALGTQSVIIFGDRCPEGALRPVAGTSIDLSSAEGAAWVNAQLKPYRTAVTPPAHRPSVADPTKP